MGAPRWLRDSGRDGSTARLLLTCVPFPKSKERSGDSRGSGEDGPLLRVVDRSGGIGDAEGDGGSGSDVDGPNEGTSSGLGAKRLDGGGGRLSSGDHWGSGTVSACARGVEGGPALRGLKHEWVDKEENGETREKRTHHRGCRGQFLPRR